MSQPELKLVDLLALNRDVLSAKLAQLAWF